MIVEANLYAAAETAAILRQVLGPARQWRDFLADCIRGRTDLHGLTLVPYAVRKGGRARSARPLYRGADIAAFIRAARAANPSLRPAPMTAQRFSVDDTMGLHWRARPATPVGLSSV